MSVTLDCSSARRLLDEGVICFDVDTDKIVCDGLPVRLPASGRCPDARTRPILVCGSRQPAVGAVVETLAARGLPAWQVHHEAATGEHEPQPCCPTSVMEGCGSAAAGGVGVLAQPVDH